jgi:hypothetical protein
MLEIFSTFRGLTSVISDSMCAGMHVSPLQSSRVTEQCGHLGPEHQADAQGNPQPSFCTLPLFHAPHQGAVPPGGGYVSGDGHLFGCRNPAVLQNAFHV